MAEDVKIGRMREVTLTGQVFPAYADNSPILLDLPGLGPSLALFGTVENLRHYMSLIGVNDYSIKRIDDESEFMESQIPFHVVCDMRYEGGKSKWSLVKPTHKA